MEKIGLAIANKYTFHGIITELAENMQFTTGYLSVYTNTSNTSSDNR